MLGGWRDSLILGGRNKKRRNGANEVQAMFRKWQEVKFDLNIGLAKRKDEKGEEAGRAGTRCTARLRAERAPAWAVGLAGGERRR